MLEAMVLGAFAGKFTCPKSHAVQGRTAVVPCACFYPLKSAVIALPVSFVHCRRNGWVRWFKYIARKGETCSERSRRLANVGKILICVYTVTDILPASGGAVRLLICIWSLTFLWVQRLFIARNFLPTVEPQRPSFCVRHISGCSRIAACLNFCPAPAWISRTQNKASNAG